MRLPSLFLLSVSILHAECFFTANQTVNLTLPSEPDPSQPVVDPNFVSYSIEFNYMQDYAGNATHPNLFSRQLLQNLGQISGSQPIIRAGGSTQDRAVFYPNQSQAIIQTFTNAWDDQPSAVKIGPNWLESFKQFPAGTRYIYGLNFYDGEDGLKQAVSEAVPVIKELGDSLQGFEIGNEMNGWAGTSRRPANWTLDSYVQQWNDFASAIVAEARKVSPGLDQRLFQGCAFTAPRNLNTSKNTWNVANAVAAGLNKNGYAMSVSDHEYMGQSSGVTPLPTLADNLLNHFHMTSLMYYHEQLGNALATSDIPYVIGETNSLSRQGLTNVSDVFGAALWAVDYVLYAATRNISALYFHNGSPYRYSAWQPISINGTAPHAKPLYYGNLFTARALGGFGGQVIPILNTTSLTAYGMYNRAYERWQGLVIVNLTPFTSQNSSASRLYVDFSLPASVVEGEGNNVRVRRLTAPGVDAKSGITFAGQAVDGQGKIVGNETTEALGSGNAVRVGAGEAVLVSIWTPPGPNGGREKVLKLGAGI